MTTLSNRLEKNWRHIIGDEFDIDDYAAMDQFLQGEEDAGRPFYPKRAEIFNALNLTPFEKVKVVIVGQDPYPREGEAQGLCFSVRKGKKVPRSLKNIHKECGIEKPSHGDLTKWAEQGVLLLNATLTVQKGIPRSHEGKGWEKFTDAVIRAVNKKPGPVVFMLWGRDAQKKRALIGKKHKVLEASHPSGFSAHRGFFREGDGEIHSFRDCGHFKEANKYLIEHGRKAIDWNKI